MLAVKTFFPQGLTMAGKTQGGLFCREQFTIFRFVRGMTIETESVSGRGVSLQCGRIDLAFMTGKA
jgi:hypothetical protein